MEIDIHQNIDGMSVAQLDALLEPVSCKPGLKFEVHQAGGWWCYNSGGPCLHYIINVTNTYHPEQTTELHMHKAIPSFVVTVEDFYDWCLGVALWFDDHEGREWFKVNDYPWRDPHAHGVVSNPLNDREVFDRVKTMRVTPCGDPYCRACCRGTTARPETAYTFTFTASASIR